MPVTGLDGNVDPRDPHRGRCACLDEPPKALDEMTNAELSLWFGVNIAEPQPDPWETFLDRLVRFGQPDAQAVPE